MLGTPTMAGELVSSAVIATVFVCWATIRPTNDRDWAPDAARTATIAGHRLVVSNLRNFNWRSETDFDQHWEQRAYDPASDSLADLAFSIETRKQRDEPYSAIAGFFNQYELAIVAADERGAVRVRSNVRGEDVRFYRMRVQPADIGTLLREYVATANDIGRTLRFCNTLTANCATLVYDMVRVVHPGLPPDTRILLSGYLPNCVYDLGASGRACRSRGCANSPEPGTRAPEPTLRWTFRRGSATASRFLIDTVLA